VKGIEAGRVEGKTEGEKIKKDEHRTFFLRAYGDKPRC
jgi:hypothetical protein